MIVDTLHYRPELRVAEQRTSMEEVRKLLTVPEEMYSNE